MATSLKTPDKNPAYHRKLTPFIEKKNKEMKFSPPKPTDEKFITNKLLGAKSESKKLEKLDLQLFVNYVHAIDASQENIAFAKKFYPKRLSLLASLILSIVMSKNLPSDLKHRALKFFHENFDIDEALIDKILVELEAIDSTHHIPFSNFKEIDGDLEDYDLYSPFQAEEDLFSTDSSKKVNPLVSIINSLENIINSKKNGNINLNSASATTRQIVIKPNPEAMGCDQEEYFEIPKGGTKQNPTENSSNSLRNPYEILKLEPRYTDESDEDFRKRLRKSYHKLILIHHPDKGGLKENFQEIHRAYEELNKDLLTENETVRQNSPSRRSA
ncbi:J domain-containing protein [Rickettsiella endosymbiont of Miltochrista miniata]|uniref:J domain-containing protein n=1 Tax=Rickettsiella endosymbiont of Miltochrista miniata TaxID=3066239 RepID=UPI00313F2163